MDTQREKAQALGVDWFTRFAKQIELGFFDAISLRLRDARWWKRHFRRVFMRRLEHVYRGHCNLVHAKKWLYTSRDNVQRRRQQKARNAAVLDMMLMVNELGQEFKLAELVEKSNANPAIRRAELMVRIAGFESVAQDLGHAGEFMTLTCPSRFHRAHRLSGAENSKYDGSTPRDASAYLNRVWARVLAELKRNDIQIYGFRVVEPHHDGCPHWHGLFFMPTEQRDLFRRIVAKHGCRDSHEELGLRYFLRKGERLQHAREVQAALLSRGEAKQSLSEIAARFAVEDEFWSKANWRVFHDVKARVDFKAINWNRGTAAGYIAKYIAKNIDGKNALGQEIGDDDESLIGESAAATAAYVDAWASLWGIRQFQQIGGHLCRCGVNCAVSLPISSLMKTAKFCVRRVRRIWATGVNLCK
ncbi:replication endonuclease [Kingella negevensis]|uniref:replication endonuclease n=1 Tax=Kingella negevensis TaxID=1522312 RepID=UPI00254E1CEC|nr:replication endonuclease [Kingella negevensis]MDK4707224.1 replication endonuclease [Kingella negevensis]MDK4710802.1 replication endonuclease [Kingella negevensis]